MNWTEDSELFAFWVIVFLATLAAGIYFAPVTE